MMQENGFSRFSNLPGNMFRPPHLPWLNQTAGSWLRKIPVFLLLVCLFPAPARALDHNRMLTQALIRKWQTPQGLPQPRILAVYQTVDGHLWIGTQSGLYLFDGITFIPPPPEHQGQLGNIWVQNLLEDPEHQLWVATMGHGLICISDAGIQSFKQASGLPSDNVQALLVDHQGTLWIGTDAGLARMISGRLQTIPAQPGLTVKNVRALGETSTGTVCIGGDQGQLNLYRDGQFITRPLVGVRPHDSIRALLGTPDGNLFVGTSSGLLRLDSKGETRIGREHGLADHFIETLAVTSTGAIWVGTRDGLSRMSGDEIETMRAREGLSQSTVCTIFEDRERNVWVGTKNGLNQFVDRLTIPVAVSEGLPSNDTGAITQDPAGNILIGTLDAGLARYDGKKCVPIADIQTGLPSDRINALLAPASETLWVGTDHGLSRMSGSTVQQTYTTQSGLPDNNVFCLLYEPDEDRLWIGTARGLATLQNNQLTPFAPDSEISQWPIRFLLNDPEAGMIIATEGGGLFRVRGEKVYPWLAEAPELRSVTSLYPSDDGVLWAATRGEGLLLLRGNQIQRMTVQHGLYDDELSGLVADDQGRLWMACSRGIFFVKKSELLELADGKIDRVSSTQFSPMEALRTIECQQGIQPSVWKMQNGNVWFATNHGAIIVDPLSVFRHLPPFPVWVERMEVNGSKVNPRVKTELPAGQTNLMFRYSGLSFAFPLKTTFRYMLEGYDSDWVAAGSRREAYYTNVPPGSYRFLVSARNPLDEWCTTTLPAEFVVRPYFYKTLWFYCLTGVALLVLIWGILRFRVYQVRSRLNAVLAERMRIARDLHDTLIQGFSGVTMQMQALCAHIKTSEERETLQDVISDAGKCLREARRTVSGLRHAPGSPTGLLEDISRAARQLTETHPIHLRLRMPPDISPLPSEVEYNVLRIVQEAIINAIKHAHAGTLTVSVRSNQQRLTFSVVDDGNGFSYSESELPPGHYGLIGMRERAHQIQALIRVESRPGRGTTVEVSLPLSHRVSGERILERT